MNKEGKHPIFRQIAFDLKHGIVLKKRNFLLPMVLAVIVCIGYYHTFQRKNEMLGTNLIPTIFDYLYNFFEGMPVFSSEYKDTFFIPAKWMVFYFWMVYINGKYPKNYLTGMGMQVLIRADKIQYWWIAKCFWTVINTVLCYVCVYSVIVVIVLVNGSWDMRFMAGYHSKVLPDKLAPFSASEFLIISVALPIAVMIALCMIQTILSMLTNTITGILGCVTILVISAYSCKWYWIGNYLMILRNDRFISTGVPYTIGILAAVILSIVCIAAGYLILKKKDFIYRKGEL